jgi:hypothetical protein
MIYNEPLDNSRGVSRATLAERDNTSPSSASILSKCGVLRRSPDGSDNEPDLEPSKRIVETRGIPSLLDE